MRPAGNMEKLVKNVDIDTNAKMDEAVLDDVLKAFEESKVKKSAIPQPSIWRIIVKSRMTKLAAAAAIIVAIIFCIYQVDLSRPAYGITDVPEILQQTCTIHIKGWQCAHVQLGLYDPNMVRPGQEETRALMEYWIDMETGRMRRTQPAFVLVKDDKVSAPVFTKVYDGEFVMQVNDGMKTAEFTRFSPYLQLVAKRKNRLNVVQEMLLSPQSLDSFKKTGQETIDAQTYDIWEAELAAPSWGDERLRFKTWVSPKTGRLKILKVWQRAGDYDWWEFAELSQIEYDVPLPDNVFATEVPPGYSARNTKETAHNARVFQNRNPVDPRGDQILTCYACFTLSGGSVILGWSCTTGWPENKWESDRYQEAIFQELVPGGGLPRLPAEFYTVSPIGHDPGVQYHGRHLAYTRKANIFHEWALYVPERELDQYYGVLSYSLHFRCNRKDLTRHGAYTLGETGDIQIKTKTDFRLFVLGAMAELSDDAKAPEHVTYENVLRMTEQIRSGLK